MVPSVSPHQAPSGPCRVSSGAPGPATQPGPIRTFLNLKLYIFRRLATCPNAPPLPCELTLIQPLCDGGKSWMGAAAAGVRGACGQRRGAAVP